MRCGRCGQRIKRRNRSGNRDAVQPCPKARDYGMPDGASCAPANPTPEAPRPRFNPDVAELARRRGPRKKYVR